MLWLPTLTSNSRAAFAGLKAANAKGQWLMSLYVDSGSGATAGTWSKVVCSTSVYGGCFNSGNAPPFDKPLEHSTAKLNVTFTYNKNNFVSAPWTSMVPSSIQFRLCYSDRAFNDRPWRKKNKAYPDLTNNCLGADHVFDLLKPSASSLPFPPVANLSALTAAEKSSLSSSIAFNIKDNDQITSATWFVMMWVVCTDGNVCAFESTEAASTLNSTGLYYPLPYTGSSIYIETNGDMGITSGMIAASIILGALGPLLWIAYMIADQVYYNKVGKQLSF